MSSYRDIDEWIDAAIGDVKEIHASPTPAITVALAGISLGIAMTKTMLLVAERLAELRLAAQGVERVLIQEVNAPAPTRSKK